MKKLSKLIVAAAVIFSPLLAGSPASAEPVCEIGFTGPNSNNLCVSTVKYACTVDNTNKVEVKNSNNQTVASGTATTSGGTTGGSATSGSATNENGANFSFTIDNSNVCTAVQVVPPTETPETPTPAAPVTPTPVTPSAVAVQPTGGGAGQIAALPMTSGDSALMNLAVVTGVLGLIAALSIGGTALYRYRKSL